MREFFKSITRALLSPFNLQVVDCLPPALSESVRIGQQEKWNVNSLDGALKRVVALIGEVETVVDIGASNGSWTEDCLRYFPNSHYLLVEANPVHAAALEEFSSGRKKIGICMAAAGEIEGDIFFHAADPFGGVASKTAFDSDNIRVPVVTLDQEIERRGLGGRFLIKLDTHGFEVSILNGAGHSLMCASCVIVECYNFVIAENSRLFPNMCEFLRARGFRVADVFDVMRRSDGLLWQMDIVFLREDHPAFADGIFTQ